MANNIPQFISDLINRRGYVPVKAHGLNTVVNTIGNQVITYVYRDHKLIKIMRDISDGHEFIEQVTP